jgi:hypothetical protein
MENDVRRDKRNPASARKGGLVVTQRRLVETGLLLTAVLLAAVCDRPVDAGSVQGDSSAHTLASSPIGRLNSPRLSESSGLVKSRKYPDIFWTHNDSGNLPALFAVKLTGEVVAEIPVAGATNVDWEDLAIDDRGNLYIGDIGDNRRRRASYQIYELPEPDPFARPIKPAQVAKVHRYRFPDRRFNCEAMFIYKDRLHIITKEPQARPIIYRLEPDSDKMLTPKPVCTLPLLFVTAADVSLDGKMLVVCCYGQLAVFEIGDDLSKIGRRRPKRVSLPAGLQTEACSFDGSDVIVTAESRQIWRITAEDIASERRSPSD